VFRAAHAGSVACSVPHTLGRVSSLDTMCVLLRFSRQPHPTSLNLTLTLLHLCQLTHAGAAAATATLAAAAAAEAAAAGAAAAIGASMRGGQAAGHPPCATMGAAGAAAAEVATAVAGVVVVAAAVVAVVSAAGLAAATAPLPPKAAEGLGASGQHQRAGARGGAAMVQPAQLCMCWRVFPGLLKCSPLAWPPHGSAAQHSSCLSLARSSLFCLWTCG
jgi:hypothetical protein